MERSEVEHIAEGIVKLALAGYHAENVARLGEINARIIGIDGNGTGRKGAIQRLEDKVDNGFAQVNYSIAGLTASSFRIENVPKQKIKHIIWVAFGAVCVAAMSFLGGWGVVWLEHAKGWK